MNISEEILLSVSRKWLKENAVPVHLLLLIYVKKKKKLLILLIVVRISFIGIFEMTLR